MERENSLNPDSEHLTMSQDRPQRAARDLSRRTPRPSADAAAQQMDHLVQQLTTLIAEREGRMDRAALLDPIADPGAAAKPGLLSRLFKS